MRVTTCQDAPTSRAAGPAGARRWIRALAALVAVVAVGTATTLVVARNQQARAAGAAVSAEQQRARVGLEALEHDVVERLVQLDAANDFVARTWPLSVAQYRSFVDAYGESGGDGGSLSFANLGQAIVIEEVPAGGVAEVVAREASAGHQLAVRSLVPVDPYRVLMRTGQTVSVAPDGGPLIGFDINPVLDALGLPSSSLARDGLWFTPLTATALDFLLRAPSDGATLRDRTTFLTADMVAVRRFTSPAGEVGWFIVPLRSAELLEAPVADGLVVELTIVGSSGQVEVTRGLPIADGDVLAAAEQELFGVSLGLRAASTVPLPSASGFDGTTVARGLLSVAIVALLSQLWLYVRHRQRHLVAELQRTTKLATTDPLTGVHNRAGFESAVRRMLDASDRGAVHLFLLDVDRFKLVNDTEGHQVGDDLLCIIADALHDVVGERAEIGRFGGDEFVLVSDQLGSDAAAMRLAHDVHARFGRPVPLGDGEHLVTVSIGIAGAEPGVAIEPAALLRDADAAMYRAKRASRGSTAAFDESMRDDARSRVRVERELWEAVPNGQIVPYYQPIFTTSGEVVAFEALARWQHPERGLLLPAKFLGVAADAGVLVELNRQILRRACAQACDWNASAPASPPVRVLVNLAEELLLLPSFAEDVERILNETGLSSSLLTLEISEDTVMSRLSADLRELRDLASLGVDLAIDDFGRGRSSLLALADLDMVRTLKLDRAFVAKLPDHEPTRAVFRAVRDVARSFDMTLVGEGVETEAEADVLLRLGVDWMQGYRFGHPSPAHVATAMLSDARAGVTVPSLGGCPGYTGSVPVNASSSGLHT
jgi:diguanylate cyclase (GGDEF)-like protein